LHGLFGIVSSEELDLELRGRTWHVYWYMLSKGTDQGVTVREIQRALAFKSPSIADHHLERLMDLNRVTRTNEGTYVLVGNIKLGILRHFVRLGRILVPRYVFYASFTTALTILYCIFPLYSQDMVSGSFVLALGLFSSFVFWYEAYRFWRLKPY